MPAARHLDNRLKRAWKKFEAGAGHVEVEAVKAALKRQADALLQDGKFSESALAHSVPQDDFDGVKCRSTGHGVIV